MEEIREIAKEIMSKCHLMNLGTQDENGVWVSTVHFVSDDDLNVYWISHESVRHSKAVLVNSKAAGTITFSTKPGDPNMGLQFEGKAERIEGNRPDLAEKHAGKRGKSAPAEGEMEAGGKYWYKLTPTTMQVIYEPKWGFNKETIEF